MNLNLAGDGAPLLHILLSSRGGCGPPDGDEPLVACSLGVPRYSQEGVDKIADHDNDNILI